VTVELGESVGRATVMVRRMVRRRSVGECIVGFGGGGCWGDWEVSKIGDT